MSVAIARVFGTALSGRSKDRQQLADSAVPWTCTLAALPARSGEALIRNLLEPLGYSVEVAGHLLDPRSPEWGPAPHFKVTLANTCRLRDLLRHLYVLIPVLDDDKHYWVGEAEIDKLLRHGEAWLDSHPLRDLIVRRSLRYQRSLARQAFELLADDQVDADEVAVQQQAEEEVFERPISLNDQRLGAVVAALKGADVSSVVDLGCGEGRLLVSPEGRTTARAHHRRRRIAPCAGARR
jgi:3' terminal RNA ribose 2'-O-methyltransferase Hen1